MNDSGSISLLLHSFHQNKNKKINVIHSIQESNLHIYYYTAQKPRVKSFSEAGRRWTVAHSQEFNLF